MGSIADLADRNPSNSATPDKIILGGAPADQIAKASMLLGNVASRAKPSPSNHAFSRRIVVPQHPDDVELLRRELGASERNVLLIFIENVEISLARALGAGENLDKAATDWQTAADRLMALAETDDPRIKVSAVDEAISSPSEFADFLAHQFNSKFEWYGDRSVAVQDDRWDGLYLLLAVHYIREHPALLALSADFRERRDFVPPGNTAVGVDWSQILDSVDALRTENCLLLEQLHKLQIEFEHNFLQLKDHEDKHREAMLKLSAAAAQNDELARQLSEKEGLLNIILSSKSWRLTKPLRASRRLITR